mmetsp:Transcript_58014/g.138106  ORF Transcript_58014/g.138106 Transcript_58014/m.138106 type:complete len:171 (-) Transcript_58014:36-548(-)
MSVAKREPSPDVGFGKAKSKSTVQFSRVKFGWREMRNPLLNPYANLDSAGGTIAMMPVTLHLLTQGCSARGQMIAGVRKFGRTWIAPDGVVPTHFMAEVKAVGFKYEAQEFFGSKVPWRTAYINSTWPGGDAWTGAKVRQFLARRHSPKQVELDVRLPELADSADAEKTS